MTNVYKIKKDGGEYKHCATCKRCVKLSYEHCEKCDLCHLKTLVDCKYETRGEKRKINSDKTSNKNPKAHIKIKLKKKQRKNK